MELTQQQIDGGGVRESEWFHLFRAVGTLLVILAHIQPPNYVFAIRNFDVVLLVVVSTLTYLQFGKKENYAVYLRHRFFKLVVPTWSFILISAVVHRIISWILGVNTALSFRTVIIGLATFSGVGYLWVMRVYIYCAILNPLFAIAKNKKHLPIFLAFLYAVYYLMYSLHLNLKGIMRNIVEISVLHFVGWGLIALFGAYLYYLDLKRLLIALTALAGVFVVEGIWRESFWIQDYKYPPLLPYISYGLAICGILFLLMRLRIMRNFSCPEMLKWLSHNSLWLYFYHSLTLNIINQYSYFAKVISFSWIVKYFLILFVSIGMTLVHNIVVSRIELR